MNKKVQKEVKELIKKLNLNCLIKEFENKVSWTGISTNQSLSESFIREFENKVSWDNISINQSLSESFIREFESKVDWDYISCYQVLTPKFRKEFKSKIDNKVYEEVNQVKTLETKTEECKEYAKKYNLEIDKEYLYAYRNHDEYGRGAYSKVISYKKGKYYRDWHCDMRKNEENSFGLGIWPQGNTKVKVKIEDWGVEVGRNDGKARVWGFEIV